MHATPLQKDKLKFLIMQTAFIGDVVLATPLIEAVSEQFPHANIDFMLRKGNEALLNGHPKLNKIVIWDKKQHKYKNLRELLSQVRNERYDYIINLQRYASTGIFAGISKAKTSIGFKQNPFSFLYTHKFVHKMGDFTHETERNLSLLEPILGKVKINMKLYPNAEHFAKTEPYKTDDYICVAPSSVWFTKQFPKEKWIEFFDQINCKSKVYLLGAPGDAIICDELIKATKCKNIENLCGKLALLESAALMKDAKMNFVNDSAPMHISSSVNAPTTAIFCSTIPAFGFGPLSDNSKVIELRHKLNCRPCGIHGKRECPEEHFDCGMKIDIQELVERS